MYVGRELDHGPPQQSSTHPHEPTSASDLSGPDHTASPLLRGTCLHQVLFASLVLPSSARRSRTLALPLGRGALVCVSFCATQQAGEIDRKRYDAPISPLSTEATMTPVRACGERMLGGGEFVRAHHRRRNYMYLLREHLPRWTCCGCWSLLMQFLLLTMRSCFWWRDIVVVNFCLSR